MENEEVYQGAKLDLRPESEKQKDFTFEEIVASAAPVAWKEKSWDEMRQFPIFDQGQSGSCVAQTGKKMLGVYVQVKTGVWVELSAAHIYKRRFNKPEGGMNGDDVFKIMQKGTTLAAFGDPQKAGDSVMDATDINSFEESIGEAFKIGNYLTVVEKNIDTIASIIQQTEKAVMVWFYFTYPEWTDIPVVKDPNLNLSAASTCRHSIAATDFTLIGKKNAPKNPELWGKKALLVDDSWGPKATGGAGRRLITEDFFNARNWFRAHFMNFKFEDQSQPTPTPTPVPGKPKHTFLRDLEFSATYKIDDEVKALQDCLKWEGCFPSNTDSTGYFGSITKVAVQKFQTKYGIASAGDAGFGRVGPKTRAKLNALFA
jgi:hypothetical protein